MPSTTEPTADHPQVHHHQPNKPPQPTSPPPDLSRILPKLTPRRRAPPQTNPQPVPVAPPLPSAPATTPTQFIKPSRRILSPEDLNLFIKSPTYDLLLAFVFALTDSVRDCPVSDLQQGAGEDVEDGKDVRDRGEGAGGVSETVIKIVDVLDQVEEVVKRCPAEDAGGSRFGNKAFKTFLDALGDEQERWHRHMGVQDDGALDEVSTYFLQSFGNRTRIDYGSGHELNFIVWLLCLYQLRLLEPHDFRAVVLKIFTRYLELMRLIQSTYYLEPAGSHGVWGLDDYQFLPFLFGASQLLHHPYIRPLSIHQPLILEQHAKDYLYLGQVAFVNSVKNVEGLRWHSPMLDDISAAKSWEKVEAGMKRMFVAEVLKKLPVMQHFLFGSLVPAVDGMSRESELGVESEENETEGGEVSVVQDGMKHVHQSNSWGDCCGIKVPSSIAAAEETKKRMGDAGLRRVPFD